MSLRLYHLGLCWVADNLNGLLHGTLLRRVEALHPV